MEDTAQFCPYCGSKSEESQQQSVERAKAFYTFRRNLRHERKSWKIFGGVWLGVSIATCFFPLIFLLMGFALQEPAFLLMGFIYFIYPLCFLPPAIVSLIMGKKITGYLDNLDTDPNPAVDRCGGVWLIVMGALFNNLALVFIIMNFIHVKTYRHLLKQ